MMSDRTERPARARVSCATCEACCCRLQVLLSEDDLGVPFDMCERDRWGGLVMKREPDGWCIALDRNTLRCSIYERRPRTCREFALGGRDCLDERRSMTGGADSGPG